jgi:hypothetical protein
MDDPHGRQCVGCTLIRSLDSALVPPPKHATAGEHERVWTVAINDGEFEIAVERRIGNALPHEVLLHHWEGSALI